MDNIDKSVLLSKIQSLCRNGQFDVALQVCNSLQNTGNKGLAEKRYFQSIVARYKRDTEKEYALLSSSLDLDPEGSGALYAMINNCVRQKEFLRALKYVDELKEIDGNKSNGLAELSEIQAAFCYYKLSESQLATQCLERCQRIGDFFPVMDADMSLGELRKRLKEN